MSARKWLLGSVVAVALVAAAFFLVSTDWRSGSVEPTSPTTLPGTARGSDLVAAPDLESRAFLDPAAIDEEQIGTESAKDARAVRGFVRTHVGDPVAGAKVSIDDLEGEVKTLADGSFRVADVPPGTWKIRARGAFGDCVPVEFEAPERFPIVLVVEPFGRLRIHVEDPTGAPLPEARISLVFGAHRPSRSAEILARGLTDASGQLIYESFPASSLHLYVRHGDFAPTRSERIEVEPGEECEVRVRMRVGARIVGTVTREENAPVHRAHVSLHDGKPHDLARTESDRDGNYALEHLEPGPYRLAVSYIGSEVLGRYETRDIQLREGETLRCDFGELGPRVVSGLVTREGGAPCESIVRVRQAGHVQFPSAGRDGRFEVRLHEGSATFEIEARDDPEAHPTRHSFVREIRDDQELLFSIPGGTIRGRILDSEGRRLTDAHVFLTRLDEPGPPVQGLLNYERTWRFDDLHPGEYRVEAFATGPIEGGERPIDAPTGRAVATTRIVTSDTVELDLVLEDSAGIEGRLVSPHGTPRGKGMAFVFDAEARLAREVPVRSTASFVVTGLTPGEHTVVVICGTDVALADGVTVRRSQGAQLVAQLARGAFLVVRAGGPFSMELRDARGIDFTTLGHDHTSIPRGSYSTGRVLGPLPPGDYTLTAKRNGIELIEPVRIGTDDVELSLSFGE